jgi:hypothetical protein
VDGNICSICCGEEREVSLSCPLHCVFLGEAHDRERPVAISPDEVSYQQVIVTEEFVREQEELLLFCVYSLMQAALRMPNAVDSDVMTALDALITTYRSSESGVVYESRPENVLAAGVHRLFQEWLKEYSRARDEREPLHPVRDSEILRLLVFLHRIGQQNQNGRPRGRHFIHLLQKMTPETERVRETQSSIIV